MARQEAYQLFLDTVAGRRDNEREPDEVTVATTEEIGWWKRFQITRAIHHMRYGVATAIETHLLDKHHIPVSAAARARTRLNERK